MRREVLARAAAPLSLASLGGSFSCSSPLSSPLARSSQAHPHAHCTSALGSSLGSLPTLPSCSSAASSVASPYLVAPTRSGSPRYGTTPSCSPRRSPPQLFSTVRRSILALSNARTQPPPLRMCYRHVTRPATCAGAVSAAVAEDVKEAEPHWQRAAASSEGRVDDGPEPHPTGESSSHQDTHTSESDPRDEAALFPAVLAASRTMGFTVQTTTMTWDAAALKQRYHELVRLHHPDVDGGDSTRMEVVNNANDLLESLTAAEHAAFFAWLATASASTVMQEYGRLDSVPDAAARDTAQMVGAGLYMTVLWGLVWGACSAYFTDHIGATTATNGHAACGSDRKAGGGAATRAAAAVAATEASPAERMAVRIQQLMTSSRMAAVAYTFFSRYVRSIAAVMAAFANVVVVRSVMVPLLCSWLAP